MDPYKKHPQLGALLYDIERAHKFPLDAGRIALMSLQRLGDVGGCYTLKAMELLYEKGPQFQNLYLKSTDKKEFTQALNKNIIKFKTPEKLSEECNMLLPGLTYYGRLVRCPLSDTYYPGQYCWEGDFNAFSEAFTITLEVPAAYGLFPSHPAFKKLFRNINSPNDLDIYKNGSFIHMKACEFEIPLEWVTGEYKIIYEKYGQSRCFVEYEIPHEKMRDKDEYSEKWRMAVGMCYSFSEYLVSDRALLDKLSFTENSLDHRSWRGVVIDTDNIFNLLQANLADLSDPASVILIDRAKKKAEAEAKEEEKTEAQPEIEIPSKPPVKVTKKKKAIVKKVPVYTQRDSWQDVSKSKELMEEHTKYKSFKSIARKFKVSPLEVQRKCIALKAETRDPICEALLKKGK